MVKPHMCSSQMLQIRLLVKSFQSLNYLQQSRFPLRIGLYTLWMLVQYAPLSYTVLLLGVFSTQQRTHAANACGSVLSRHRKTSGIPYFIKQAERLLLTK